MAESVPRVGGVPASDFSAIPEALRSRPQWLCWRLEEKPGAKKPAKMPYYASGKRRTGVQGSPEDRAGLVTFDAAQRAMTSLQATGIGFAFLPDDGLIGIDLDHAVNPQTGELSDRTRSIIDACASYTEWSPSGAGFHIYVMGTTQTAKDNGIGVEMFCGRQYFTVTGRHVSGTPGDVTPIAEEVLQRLHALIAKGKTGSAEARAQDGAPGRAPGPVANQGSERERIQSALDVVDSGIGYDAWLQVGMALESALGADGFSLWDAWSARSDKYPGRKTLEAHWKSFKPGAVRIGTLFHLAKAAGWKPLRMISGPPPVADVPPENQNPPAPTGGAGADEPKKPKKPIDWGRYRELLSDFVLIYGTDTVYDTKMRLLLKVNHLRLAFGSDYVKMWLAANTRRMIMPDQLVFDPQGRCEPPAINLFEGLPVEPKAGDCAPIVELLQHLCADSAESEMGVEAVMSWVLNWLAMPLQRLGTKMRSALVFHGPQGAGKNLFFEIVAAIYGRHALVVGQSQLESDFNDWASQKLFLIGDEVVARQELYHQKNKLKAFITGETIQINTKMMPLRTEANHVNVVFLSNEPHPLALEEGDRRYLVVYTPPMRNDDLYRRVAACLAKGGARAFHHYLLSLDLTGVTEFDIPIMTRAKRDLIEMGLKPSERFAREWLSGYLPLPLAVCSAGQLYRAAKRWAAMTGERFLPIQDQFSKAVKKTVELAARKRDADGDLLRYKVVRLDDPVNGKKSERMWIPDGCGPGEDVTEGAWAADCVASFERSLGEFVGNQDRSGP